MEKRSQIYIALIHYPVTNKRGDKVTTAITNFDIHDIARTARTYGIENYFLVTPLESQIMLAERILEYWSNSQNPHIIPDRQDALSLVKVVTSMEKVIEQIVTQTGHKPIIVATDAKEIGTRTSYSQLRKKMENENRPYLIIFGTGYGLLPEVLEKSDYILDPIRGRDPYNHLSVRAAAAIILDRLLGEIERNHNPEIQTMKQTEENYASSY